MLGAERRIGWVGLVVLLLGVACSDGDSGANTPEPAAGGESQGGKGGTGGQENGGSEQGGEAGHTDGGQAGAGEGGAAGSDAGAGGGQGGSLPAGCVPAPDLGVLKEAPATLSGTGLPEDGTVPSHLRTFKPRYELWSDAAVKERFVYLPGCEAIDTSDMDHWSFPVGTRFWKHFRINGVLVETRFSHRFGPGPADWMLETYQWNEAQTKAVLVKDGVPNANGTEHDIPAQSQCSRCHSFLPERSLGFSALQLSHDNAGLTLPLLAAEGRIGALAADGFSPPGDSVAQDALGYLHANCGHCHNDAFGLPLRMRLRVADAKIEDTDIFQTAIGVKALFQIEGFPLRIAPGDPGQSLLVHRMSSRGSDAQMPPLATEKKDDKGLARVQAWIDAMKSSSPGGGDPGEPLEISGSRLKARRRVSTDGYQDFIGWYDTKLGINCTVDRDPVGVLRCLPEASAGSLFFHDASCSKQAASGACLEPSVQLVRDQQFNATCASEEPRFRVLRLGAPIKGSVFENSGSCEAIASDQDLRPVEEVVDPEQFASFAVQQLPTQKDGFGLLAYKSSDGARQTIGAWSQVAGRVQSLLLDDGKEHWAPSVAVTAFHIKSFADPSCGVTPIGYAFDCGATPVVAVGLPDGIEVAKCGGQAIFNVIEPLPGLSKVFSTLSGACSELEAPPQSIWYRLGDKLDPATLPLSARLPIGGQRLQRAVLTTPGGQHVVFPYDPGTLTDTKDGVPCDLFKVSADSWRCVPRGYSTQIFQDSACSKPIVAIPKSPDLCSAPTAEKYAVLTSFLSCGVSQEVHAIEGQLSPGEIFLGDGTNCSSLGAPEATQNYFAVGALVDPSGFVELKEITEN